MDGLGNAKIHEPPQFSGGWQTLMIFVALLLLALWSLVLPHGDSGDAIREALLASTWYKRSVAGLWLLIIAEGLVGMFWASDRWSARLRRWMLLTFLPPFRMVLSTWTSSQWLWFPFKGWQRAGVESSLELEKRFAVPMVLVTLLVVPVVIAELGFGAALDSRPKLAIVVHLITCVIWTGFAFEFLWMIAATPEKWRYTTRHWVNLIIILLPMVAFLRFLRILKFASVFKAGQFLRAFRMRGLWMRLWRTILLFDLLDRVLRRNPEQNKAALQQKIAEAESELKRLRAKLRALEAPTQESDGSLSEHGLSGESL